jgi:hypothetical protein
MDRMLVVVFDNEAKAYEEKERCWSSTAKAALLFTPTRCLQNMRTVPQR